MCCLTVLGISTEHFFVKNSSYEKNEIHFFYCFNSPCSVNTIRQLNQIDFRIITSYGLIKTFLKEYKMKPENITKALIFTACVMGILYTSGGITRMIYELIIN
jgi:hypothetical protein